MFTESTRRSLVGIGLVAILINSFVPPTLLAGGWPSWSRSTRNQTTVERLAGQIDQVEKHIDEYGSVVPKAPDVWGEARLTKYRREYEEEMKKQLDQFKVTINAAVSRSDQAFLASALSLQAAVSGPGAVAVTPTSTSDTSTTTAIGIPEGADVEGAISDFETVIKRSDKAHREILGFGEVGKQGIALEPTIVLDQMSRYLNHLHELRRISDGDDKADAPGYALHLVRMPISILPGDKTREGYGAEVTVIAKPHLHEKLLPETFRGLVINDLVDQMTFPLAKFLDRADAKTLLDQIERLRKLEAHRPELEKLRVRLDCQRQESCKLQIAQGTLRPAQIKSKLAAIIAKLKCIVEELRAIEAISAQSRESLIAALDLSGNISLAYGTLSDIRTYLKGSQRAPRSSEVTQLLQSLPGSLTNKLRADVADDAQLQLDPAERLEIVRFQRQSRAKLYENIDATVGSLDSAVAQLDDIFEQLKSAFESTDLVVPSTAVTPSRRSRFAFPPSHLMDVYGQLEILTVAKLAYPLKESALNAKHTLLLDLQKFLAEEFQAAYDFLNQNPHLWEHCQTALHDAVRRDDKKQLKELRDDAFFQCLNPAKHKHSHTGAMAWMIIVESALLNERLKDDIRLLAAAKNAFCLNVDTLEWMNFFGPDPALDARMLFNDYVNCRWPIHVVAVDPITQDQNVADSFSQRREMQLALSLGFASGSVGANSFTRMARRLELDMETIALNRTVVGFSHGSDTFGWRFYPRVQSPDTGGHLQTFAVDMFKGISRDRELRERRLEPGVREVTAVVIMPSFVPYVIFDTRTNWFKLTDPTKREFTLQDTVAVSADITRMRQLSTACAQDAHLYRQDEVYRLTRAVEQLERRLPLQTTYAQMPFENSLGGFEFFNTGTADLAPELHGFYGESGIRVKTEKPEADKKTTIFLVGNHFSVHETNVIAGNQPITGDDKILISRQVLQISVPETATTVDGDKSVDIHVATPYGVSNHILVPAVSEAAAAAAAAAKHEAEQHLVSFAWLDRELNGCLEVDTIAKTFQLGFIEPTFRVGIRSDTPFTPAAETFKAEFAAWVEIKPTGGEFVRLKSRLAPFAIDFNASGRALISTKDPPFSDNLRAAINAALQKGEIKSNKVEAIRLTGFVRGRAQDHEELPILRISDTMTIKLVPCTPECCPPTPSANRPPPAVTPFTPQIEPESVTPLNLGTPLEPQPGENEPAAIPPPPMSWRALDKRAEGGIVPPRLTH